MAVKFPSAAEVKAINKTLRERAALVGFTAFMPNYSYLILDPEGRYIAQAWRDQVDSLIFNVLCNSYLVPIHDSSKYDKTIAYTKTDITRTNTLNGVNSLEKTGENFSLSQYYVKPKNTQYKLNLGINERYGYYWEHGGNGTRGCTNYFSTYMNGSDEVLKVATGTDDQCTDFHFMCPPRITWNATGYALGMLMQYIGETDFILTNSPDFTAWLDQRKKFLDAMIFLPDTRKDCGGKQDYFSANGNCSAVSTKTGENCSMRLNKDFYYFPSGDPGSTFNVHILDKSPIAEEIGGFLVETYSVESFEEWCRLYTGNQFGSTYYYQHWGTANNYKADSILSATFTTDCQFEIGMVVIFEKTKIESHTFYDWEWVCEWEMWDSVFHVSSQKNSVHTDFLQASSMATLGGIINKASIDTTVILPAIASFGVYTSSDDYGAHTAFSPHPKYPDTFEALAYKAQEERNNVSFFLAFTAETLTKIKARVESEGYADITALLSFKDW